MRKTTLAGLALLLAPLLGLALGPVGASPLRAATLEGRVLHPDGERDLSGLPVHLVKPLPDGEVSTEQTQTAPGGTFRFESLAPAGTYGVYVEYQDVTFPLEIIRLPEADPEQPLSVTLEVHDPSFETSRVGVFDLRTIVDRGEAGVYNVRQRVLLANSGSTVVFAREPAEPLVKIGLLPRHEDVEAVLSMQLAPAQIEIEGNLATYRGPVFPGFQALELIYQVDAGGRDLDSLLWFPSDVASFKLMVPDRRQAVYATGLYPSMRNSDERAEEPPGYQYFRGFDLTAGTRIPIRIEEIPPRSESNAVAVAGLALLLFGLCVVVGGPIFVQRANAPEVGAREDSGQVASAALASSLDDLEHDFEVGKISAADRDRLRDEMRREAALELALARRGQAQAAPTPATAAAASTPTETRPANFCSQCGLAVRAGDRFCSGCGTRL